MHPRRPDSAKTHFTKRTEASDNEKHQLNSSKFSQTFSSGVNSFHDKPDQFAQYVAQKDKQQKFKHLKSKLEVIQERTAKVDGPKPSMKPFQKKRTSDKMTKKIEQKPDKPEQQLNLSRGFADRTKKKMEALNVNKTEDKAVNDKLKSRINFESFKVVKPGDKKQEKKGIKVQVKRQASKNATTARNEGSKTPQKQVQPEIQKQQKQKGNQKSQQQKMRESQLRDLERYVSQIQARNMSSFPSQYDRMINASPANTQDLQKIDLNNFLEEPSEQGFNRLRSNIEEFDRQIGSNIEEQSIDLEQIINGEESPEKQQQKQDDSYLESMSASELKKRNGFITEILGGRISKKQIDELSQMDRSAIRLHKLDKQKPEEDDDVEFPEINMMKKQSQRMIEKNKIEAGGHLYRDCDYLPPELQKRIEQLLEGDIGDSPFECDELQSMRRRRIDQGIRMYRQMSNASELQQILDSQILPKDPQARNNAEKRILQEKMKSVNERLGDVDKVQVTKEKLKALVKQYEFTKRSESYNELCEENKQRFEQNVRKIAEAEQLLHHLEQKQNINEIIGQIEQQYNQIERQIKKWSEIDDQKFRQMEKERLKRKLMEVEQMQKQNEDLEGQIQKMEKIKQEARQSLATYYETEETYIPQLKCEGYNPHETLDDIDAVISKKFEHSGVPQELQNQA